ncbi:hypothetical protein [Palleronia caenipelagi]|nr:hypothetical protein [Palleronia caenipelagi]
MSEIIAVGVDLAENVFQVHGANIAGRAGDVTLTLQAHTHTHTHTEI